MTNKALDRQEGGGHYKNFKIQPVEFCQVNKIPTCEANVIKYVCRHSFKNGREDIKKAIHYLELLLQLEYPETEQSSSGIESEEPRYDVMFRR